MPIPGTIGKIPEIINTFDGTFLHMRDLSYTDATGKRFLEAGEFIVSVGGRKLTFEVVD